MDRQYVDVKYEEREDVRALGAMWDKDAKRWFIPKGTKKKPFDQYLPQQKEHPSGKASPREVAYQNQSRDAAVSKHPELAPLYQIESNARIFLEENRERFNDAAATEFIRGVRAVCFDDLESGVDIGKRLGESSRERNVTVDPELG